MELLTVWIAALLCGCANAAQAGTSGAPEKLADGTGVITMENAYTVDTKITDVIKDPAFGDYGRLIFPVNNSYYSGDTLGDLHLTWYNNIDPAKTVEIVNYMKTHTGAGDTIFYDIYTDGEKAADPAKENTGLFFFKGNPGERFAICNAGGGFAYVGAMHDSFPHALELSKVGYNAFALIYRPGAQTACSVQIRRFYQGRCPWTPAEGFTPCTPSSFFLERKKEPKKELQLQHAFACCG